jgi:hypothetical protein
MQAIALYNGGNIRKQPYTETGIIRLKCSHCGGRPSEQWHLTLCSAKHLKGYYPLCNKCDIELNKYTLQFFQLPNIEKIISDYENKLTG